jgi:hypothetical protein
MVQSYEDALWRAAARHGATLPLWLGRASVEGMPETTGILLSIIIDPVLAILHRRANRLVERDHWDQFGQHASLTKAYYLPEAFCVYVIVRDTIDAIILLRGWL